MPCNLWGLLSSHVRFVAIQMAWKENMMLLIQIVANSQNLFKIITFKEIQCDWIVCDSKKPAINRCTIHKQRSWCIESWCRFCCFFFPGHLQNWGNSVRATLSIWKANKHHRCNSPQWNMWNCCLPNFFYLKPPPSTPSNRAHRRLRSERGLVWKELTKSLHAVGCKRFFLGGIFHPLRNVCVQPNLQKSFFSVG